MTVQPPADIVDRALHVVEVPTDRCDACGHRAYVFAALRNGSLAYCAHHGTEYMDALTRQAVTVVDLRHTLHEEP